MSLREWMETPRFGVGWPTAGRRAAVPDELAAAISGRQILFALGRSRYSRKLLSP